ncbi:STAS domain-containing protein [Nonomuraea zeae]|uniref:STAS domain-containing protein n=1 Tax=Nonomuraea zeae TaxID=1642303 RepID=UPI001F0D188C|nr:STAS domain-containing protein [Nonomuraea zeae]
MTGELDITNHAKVADYLCRSRQRPADQVVLDLAGLAFMDSSGLRALLSCHQDCLGQGGELRLAALQAVPARLMEITGVHAHLSVHHTVDQALSAALTKISG